MAEPKENLKEEKCLELLKINGQVYTYQSERKKPLDRSFSYEKRSGGKPAARVL